MGLPLRKPSDARAQMPGVSSFIDSLREAFGREEIDQCMKRGLRDGTFWAVEGEFVVGNPPPEALEEHARSCRGGGPKDAVPESE